MFKSLLKSRKRILLSSVALLSVAAIACGTDDTLGPASSNSGPGSIAPPPGVTVGPPTPSAGVSSGSHLSTDNAAFVDVELLGTLDDRERKIAKSLQRVWQTNWNQRIINLSSVLSGGVPRDGIPPIDNPRYKSVADAPGWLDPEEPVIAVEINGDARAYPLNILLRHEIVNTEIGGEPVAVTFCPLCNSSLVFKSTIDGIEHRFGVSGFLLNSDLIMWDDKTQSWWQQLTGDAIVGDYVGRRLVQVPAQVVSWETFADEFPDGRVMDRPGGSGSYENTPYTGYDDSNNTDPFLFQGTVDPRAEAIDRVSAIDIGSGPVAYHFSFLSENPVVNDVIGDTPVLILFDNGTESAFRSAIQRGEFATVGSSTTFFRDLDGRILTFSAVDGVIKDDQTGSTWSRFGKATAGELAGEKLLPLLHGDHFWFAWAAFKPDTSLIKSIDQLSTG